MWTKNDVDVKKRRTVYEVTTATVVPPCISKDESKNMTAHNSRDASNSRIDNNKTGNSMQGGQIVQNTINIREGRSSR
jgi:hypothetical protein